MLGSIMSFIDDRTDSSPAKMIGIVGTSSTKVSQLCASRYERVKEATTVMSAAPSSTNGAASRNILMATAGPKFVVIPSSSSGTKRRDIEKAVSVIVSETSM